MRPFMVRSFMVPKMDSDMTESSPFGGVCMDGWGSGWVCTEVLKMHPSSSHRLPPLHLYRPTQPNAPDVGSSRKMSCGASSSSAAMESRLRSPPEIPYIYVWCGVCGWLVGWLVCQPVCLFVCQSVSLPIDIYLYLYVYRYSQFLTLFKKKKETHLLHVDGVRAAHDGVGALLQFHLPQHLCGREQHRLVDVHMRVHVQ